MKLKVSISKLKSIKSLEIELPVDRGIYAITGQNATGKSTLIAAAATSFYFAPMNRYFGKDTEYGEKISFTLGDKEKKWIYDSSGWHADGKLRLKGFYEGSIIFGNRFRDTNIGVITKIENISPRDIMSGHQFIKDNLGIILHNDKDYYEELLTVDAGIAHDRYDINGVPYFYKKNGKTISQYHMSTGENLLLTILHSIKERIDDRKDLTTPCMLLLDEVELALHPSSLARLMKLCRHIAKEFNMAIYFSTHSIELIREIDPENIFYIDRMIDDQLMIINPCYPSYATKILYDHFGYDTVILVEDDLAKIIVDKILRELRLLDNKLVHVMPCGTWDSVLRLAHDVVDSNLLSKYSKIIVILDRDCEKEAPIYVSRNKLNVLSDLNYLPVQSVEKFLKKYLFVNFNQDLFKFLNDYIFQNSLKSLLEEYKRNKDFERDNNGKMLYKKLMNFLDERGKTRKDFVEIIIDYIFRNRFENIIETEKFLQKKLA